MLSADSNRVATVGWMRTDASCLVQDAATLETLITWPLPEGHNASARSDSCTILLHGDALFIGDGERLCIDVWMWRTASITHALRWPTARAVDYAVLYAVRSLATDGQYVFAAFNNVNEEATIDGNNGFIKVWAIPSPLGP